MTDFSGGSDISARLFRNILNMKTQNQQNTSNQASNKSFYKSVYIYSTIRYLIKMFLINDNDVGESMGKKCKLKISFFSVELL